MTIESPRRDHHVATGRPLLLQGATALGVWFAMLVVLTVLVEPTRDVVVIGPAGLAALADSDTRIGDVGRLSITVRGMERGFVRALYAGGAWLVLPSRVGGCLGLRRLAGTRT